MRCCGIISRVDLWEGARFCVISVEGIDIVVG
jgi:hypothetical protein